MKYTNFQKNQKVFDSILYPNHVGRVLNVDLENETVYVKFIPNDDNDTSLETENEFYNLKGVNEKLIYGTPTLSTTPYLLKNFKQEYIFIPDYKHSIKWIESKIEENYDSRIGRFKDLGYYLTEIDTSLGLLKELIVLRDFYNELEFPDYTNGREKYTIESDKGNQLIKGETITSNKVMCFMSEKTRDKFFDEQYSLLEEVVDLL